MSVPVISNSRKSGANVAAPPRRARHRELVGPLGFEPRTKGFTWSRRFRQAWTISSPAASVGREGAGRSCLSSRALKPSGSLCTVRRCTAGLAQDCHQPHQALEGFPEFVPSTRNLSRPGHLSEEDESPALTTELQARRKSNKTTGGPRSAQSGIVLI